MWSTLLQTSLRKKTTNECAESENAHIGFQARMFSRQRKKKVLQTSERNVRIYHETYLQYY